MPNKKAAWTIMVYLAGDNNLTSECLFALTEMKKAAPGPRINVIAQFDPRDEYLTTHRYEINKGGPNSTLFDDIIDEARYDRTTGEVRFKRESQNAASLAAERYAAQKFRPEALDEANLVGSTAEDEVITDDTDTGSPITLYNFISFCLEEYPAEHYMVVLSGHAGGTQRDYLMKDESSTGSLTFNELKQVFRRIQQDRGGEAIDIVGMDNCLMSMGEICYELRGLVDIVVGCESYSPASGWPYRPILERIRKDFSEKTKGKNSLLARAAKSIVEEYVNYYANYWMAGMSVTQSALDVTKVEKLRKVVNKLADKLQQGLLREYDRNHRKPQGRKTTSFQDALVLAHWEAQSYNGELFVDLYDFCDCVENRLANPEIAKSCREVKRFISSQFVLKSCYSGAAYQYSHGVSVYFPWSQVANNYWNLDFIRNSEGFGWGRFLDTYTNATRREPRGINKQIRLSEISTALPIRTHMTSVRMSSDRMSSDRMSSDRMSSDRMSSDRMSSDRMSSDRMSSDRMSSDRMSSDRMSSDRMSSDRMSSDRMSSDRMSSDRMSSDRMSSDRMSSGLSGNPIHSMRNPPIVFLPNDCIRQRRKIFASQERFFK